MNSRGSITLGELVGKLDLLEIRCHRSDRHGRVSLARLIDEHGADTGLPDLWVPLAGDCQHARSTALHNRCAIYYPQLPGLFPGTKRVSLVGCTAYQGEEKQTLDSFLLLNPKITTTKNDFTGRHWTPPSSVPDVSWQREEWH